MFFLMFDFFGETRLASNVVVSFEKVDTRSTSYFLQTQDQHHISESLSQGEEESRNARAAEVCFATLPICKARLWSCGLRWAISLHLVRRRRALALCTQTIYRWCLQPWNQCYRGLRGRALWRPHKGPRGVSTWARARSLLELLKKTS